MRHARRSHGLKELAMEIEPIRTEADHAQALAELTLPMIRRLPAGLGISP
jgi:hypothetical protein